MSYMMTRVLAYYVNSGDISIDIASHIMREVLYESDLMDIPGFDYQEDGLTDEDLEYHELEHCKYLIEKMVKEAWA